MKQKGIRITLALMLSLVLLLGAGSAVEAKGNPHRSVTITPQATFDGTAYDLSFDLSWEAYRIQRISYGWYYWDGDSWEYWGGAVFTHVKATRSWSGSFSYHEFNPQDVDYGDKWMIAVVLYQPKGKAYKLVYQEDVELVWLT